MPLLDIDDRQRVTANAVTLTLTLDEDTCYQLSQTFLELGAALSRARRTHKAGKLYKAKEPWRKAERAARQAAIASRLAQLPPGRKAIPVIAKEFGLKYDTADFLIQEVRRAERREAALERDKEIMQLSKSGHSASLISKRFGLSAGTVKNILSRVKKETAPPSNEKAKDALLPDAV